MVTKTLMIKQLSRSPRTGNFDELNFEPGINVLVGRPSTGKTQWLRMLNYLMGDRDSNPSNAFDEALVEKYESVKGTFLINNEEIILERNWKKPGSKGKIYINGDPINSEDFSSELLSRLDIPLVHYPKGDPFSFRAWPELSWPTLLRHIYRKQTSWGELVNQQPEVEQHACLMLFLGIAEYLFSEQYGQLVEKQKEIFKKQVRKEEFINTLNQISRELLSEQGLEVAVTASSVDSAIHRFEYEIDSLLNQRTEVLDRLRNSIVQDSNSAANTVTIATLSDRWAQLQSDRSGTAAQIKATQSRLQELVGYRTKLSDELSRIERAKSAGQIFRDLRVSHCPVCEQPVNLSDLLPGHCYLCRRLTDSNSDDSNTSEQRLDFEIEQLTEESKEAEQLINVVDDELKSLFSHQRSIEEEIVYVQSQMKPIQTAAAAILPPEISQIDMDLGRFQERMRQLERIKDTLEFQENLSEQIAQAENEISVLETEVAELNEEINFERAKKFFVDEINTYLNALQYRKPNSWTQGAVQLRLNNRSFRFTAGGKKISSLSATMTLYFLPAYNYALLALSNKEKYHYPGLTILDFPATFSDGSLRTDTENFILEPFIDLVSQPGMKNTQVIAVGSAFEGLRHAHRIELDQVWR